MVTSNLNGTEIKINKVRQIQGTKDTFMEVLDYEYEGKIRVGDRMG